MKKPMAPLDGGYIQKTSEWITDGRILIYDMSMFRFKKPIDMLVNSGKDFSIYGDKLSFKFEPHKTDRLTDGDFVEFIDTKLIYKDYDMDLMILSENGNPNRREFWNRKYFAPLAGYADKIEISSDHKAKLYDYNGKLFAILMGCRPTAIEYLMKLEGSL